MSAKSSRASLDTLGTCGTHRPASRHPSRNAPLAGSVASAAGINLRQLALFTLIVILGYQSVILVNANDIDNDLIFDESDDAEDSTSDKDFMNENAVSPVSSPILQIFDEKHLKLNGKNVSKSVSKKGDNLLQATEEDYPSDPNQVDDEDYLEGEASGISDGGSATELEPDTEPPPPVQPTDELPDFYRITFYFPSLPYTEGYSSRQTPEWQSLNRQLINKVEPLFSEIQGEHWVTLLTVEPHLSGCRVMIDVGSRDSHPEEQYKNIIMRELQKGQIAGYRVDPTDFNFKPVKAAKPPPFGTLPPCKETEFTCGSNECIDKSKHCDQTTDCVDGSDEVDCDDTTTPLVCHPDYHFMCDQFKCVEMNKKCDGIPDCSNGADEQNCPKLEPDVGGQRCSAGEFQCHSGQCVEGYRRCDSMRDCPNGEDELDCTRPNTSCAAGQFQCNDNVTCIDQQYRCDRRYDCPDYSDEYDCDKCTPLQFRCGDGTCIDLRLKCNRQPDCIDYSDERDCVNCTTEQFRCGDDFCIDVKFRCDGQADCRDNSDEQDCPCRSDQFQCRNGVCIDSRRRCDRYPDCGDGSDESNCPGECASNEIRCHDGSCIHIDLRCNGYNDCNDGYDEEGCPTCSSTQFRCNDGTCIENSKHCNYEYDCPDFSDEVNCSTTGPPFPCGPNHVECEDGSCVPDSKKCDGRLDCIDGKDERDCVEKCTAGQFRCDGTCLDNSYRCDGRRDCSDYSDELNCTDAIRPCHTGQFQCQDRSCIDLGLKCDNHRDCPDGSDEVDCECTSLQFRCPDGSCIDIRRKCDGRNDCLDGFDESNCFRCRQGEFQCGDGTCIPAAQHCDGRYDCRDLSDETRTCDAPCRSDQFKCTSGECISSYFHCDRKYDCRDNSDELNCPLIHCTEYEFRCQSGECIDVRRHCDGSIDCSDRSDEIDCPALQGNISITTYPNSQVIEQGREVVFQCRDEGTQRAPVKWNRAGGYPLPPNSTDVHGRLTMPNIQLHHSGSYICSVAGVLASAEHSKWANLTVVPFVYPTARPLGVCSREEATCQNGQCIIREYVCDSDFDCEDGSDELNCRRTQSVCEPTDFQCENKKCIRKIWRCDGENDCGDNSDESLCATLEPGHCEYKEIKCGNTDQCVPKSFQCDGEMDCQDGSDEIGCRPPTVIQPPPETIMVTVGETVTITCIAIGTPVPLISWRRNWGHIPPQPRVTTTSEDGHGVITIRNAQESDSGAYSCEATNSKESVLARPDAQLIVKPLAGVCQPPYFNINGKSLADCLQCFCFGHTNDCFSSGLYITQLPHGTVISVIAVSTTSSGSYIFNDQRYTLNQDLILHLPQAQEFRIDERFYRSAASNVIYYWNLPAPFLQNKLTSYGGYLHYSINYRSRPNSTPVFAPDVVVKGNSLTLYARGQPVQEGVSVESAIQFWEGTWFRLSPGSRGDGSDPLATRQDIMQVLQNLEAIWIRASYVYEFGETSLISLKMDTASSVDDGHGRAVFVEQCTCPPGYEGLSCESCASGYSRLSTGRYLGECRRTSCECHGHSESCDSAGNCYNCQHNTEGSRCEKCQDGYYGDPQSGSICQPCPCPLTILSNQFSSTCFLDVDGEPTCSACPREYVGRQCQSCAPGYHGDPNIPGQSCTTAVSPCDPIGSYLPQPDPRTGLCQCKDYVTGPTCSQCQHDKFYLNEHTLGGCLNCFCMGIIPTCRSSQLFRSTESVIFANDRAGFAITDLDLSHTEEQSIRVNSVSHQIYFREFNRLSPGRMYYWKLPQNFLGNKLTSYGGNLTYTVHYSAAFSGRQSPGFDVQIMGNRITLGYRHFYQPQQQTTTTISVPLFERYWKRSDGQPATREHLMMALAKLNTILIKAMYSDQMLETSIKDVSLETTVAYNNGQRQAIEVEQCRCPIGYKGTSCEECDSGYTRSSGGLYLGLCEPCFCNGHSRDCDPDTGLCRNCQNNTTGNFCEQCLPGYHGNATERTSGCIFSPISTCSCDKKGTLENSCDTTGLCTCKTNVVGDNCNQCKPGFFNLEERNPEGCSKCFCFGHSFDCTSSSYFRSQIRPLLSDSRNHGFVITDRYQSSHSEDGIWINENTNEIGFRPSQFHDVHGRSFFSLPSLFTGNRLNSYGGKLQFFIKYTANRNGQPLKDSDVIITGNNMSLHYINHSFYLQPDSLQRFEVELTEAHWQLTDPRFRGSLTRENFMSVLANIQGLLIRASQHESMTEVVLSDVQMDSAVPQYNGQVLAHAVEICQCPPGYIGHSCEECAPGYIREHNMEGPVGRCLPCNCHRHSDYCEPNTRQCQSCQHNTMGPNCERCAEGYYGDATVGTPDDCQPCPCPLTISSNQFTRTCYLDSDGQPTCHGCPAGYSGRNCDECSAGYTGNPRQAGDSCKLITGPSSIIHVQIREPKYQQASEGDTVTFVCVGYSQVRDFTYNVVWTREDGRPLSHYSHEAAGTLTIQGVRSEDSGTYICTGSDIHGVATDRAVLRVDKTPGRIHVNIVPHSYEARPDETVRFDCRVEGAISATTSWSKAGQSLPSGAVQVGNMLILQSVDESYRGIYICTVVTPEGSSTAQSTLNIVQETGRPTAVIEPEQQTVPQGSEAEIRCIVSGEPAPKIEWQKAGEQLPTSHQIVGNTLRIHNVAISDRGVYVCSAENGFGFAQASGILEVERREPPAIEIYPSTIETIPQSASAMFQCRIMAGAPSPTVEWTRKDGHSLPRNAEVLSGGVIRFMHVTGEEQGRYVCTARNTAGSATAVVSLIIEGLPEITISPPSPYTVEVGQTVHLVCRAMGDPSTTVSWQFPSQRSFISEPRYREIDRAPSTATLEISNVQQEDEGYYSCKALNQVGYSEERLHLIVNQGYVPTHPSPREFVVQEGARAELRCSTYGTDSSQYSIQWVRSNGRPMPSNHTVTRSGVLTIDNVHKQDAGDYSCLGVVNGTIRFSVITTVVVLAPPRLNVSPVTMTARPGERVMFRCHATGDEPIHINWKKVSGSLSHSAIIQGGDLIFQNVGMEDAGRYVCTARNHIGEAEGVVEVYINEFGCRPDSQCLDDGCISDCSGPAPSDDQTQQLGCDNLLEGACDDVPYISVPQKNQTVYVGSTVDLVCEAHGHPPPSIVWSRDREALPIHSQIEGNILRITKVLVEDGGKYICTASNEAGISSDFTFLNVQGISQVAVHIEPSLSHVRTGDNLTVRCAAVGDPSATTSWSKVDGPLLHNTRIFGDTLHIENVETLNGGVYRCTVSTFTGNYQEDYVLNIQNIASLTQNTQVETKTAPLGTNVVMECRANLNQPASYIWSKQDGMLSPYATIEGSILRIADVRMSDAGTYICTARDLRRKLEIPTVLTVTGVVPYFAQAPVSYMLLPTLPDAYLIFDIELSFKPESHDGLILYNGQHSDGSGDFISFGLSRGYAEFRFDVGSGPAILRSVMPLEIGKWHTVKLHRNRKDGAMNIQGQQIVNGSAGGMFQGLDLSKPFYVGGVSDFSSVHHLSGFNRSFVGCISRLIIGGVVHDLSHDSSTKYGVTTCETCALNPCTNAGVCQEALTYTGYRCICPAGFSGVNCETVGESCYPGLCGMGRCVDLPTGFQCYCPYGKAGRHCEKDITIYEPAFRDDAYVAYPTPKTMKKHKFLLKFKPRSLNDGLLMYCARTESGQGDFISLTVKDKKVEFRFDTGSGPAILQSNNNLKEDEWVTVIATRDLREGTLTINDEEEVRGMSPGATRGLNLRTPLYVGGFDKERVTVSPFVDVTAGFNGCISEVEVGDAKVDMVNALIDSANVDDCGGHAPCQQKPCLNNGKCHETGPSPNDYFCTCESGFTGVHCEEEDDICNVITPCLNGGTCLGTGTSYRCRCPLGFAGKICDQRVEISYRANFQGDSYLELDRELLPHKSSTISEVIHITFETSEPNGLILWHGQTPDTNGKGQDYLALAIVDGYLVFSYELGSGPSKIRSSVIVHDSRPHRVILKRMGREGSLELDEAVKEYGESEGILQMLNTKGNIYFGGTPNAALMTAGQFTDGFIGCISDVDIQSSGPLNLMEKSLSGSNVLPCDSSGNEDYLELDTSDNTIPK